MERIFGTYYTICYLFSFISFELLQGASRLLYYNRRIASAQWTQALSEAHLVGAVKSSNPCPHPLKKKKKKCKIRFTKQFARDFLKCVNCRILYYYLFSNKITFFIKINYAMFMLLARYNILLGITRYLVINHKLHYKKCVSDIIS